MNAPSKQITLDCCGLQCPAPILQIARTARSNTSGPVVLTVTADDQDFPVDVRAWCRTAQATLLREEEVGGVFTVWLGLNGASAMPQPAPDPTPALPPPPPPQMLPKPQAQAQAPSPDDAALDLQGVGTSEALLRMSAALLRSPSGLDVLVDNGELVHSVQIWAATTRTRVVSVEPSGAVARLRLCADQIAAPIVEAAPEPAVVEVTPEPQLPATVKEKLCTLLVLHNDFEALMAALMVANASAAQSMKVEIYFSFWGINLLRADRPGTGEAKPPLLQRLMAWMMPAGPRRQVLGKMHMGGMGTGMMTHLMRKRNILSLSELLDAAEEQGVTFVGCTMSMGLMGIRRCDLVERDNLTFGGVTAFVESAQRAQVSLVF